MIIKGANQDTYIKKQVDEKLDEKLSKDASQEEIESLLSKCTLSNDDIDRIFEEV